MRKLAVANDSIYVITGPVFKDNKGIIGSDSVTVPGYYFKVIYLLKKEKIVSYLLPNRKIEKGIDDFIVPIDSIEHMSNINFNSFVN